MNFKDEEFTSLLVEFTKVEELVKQTKETDEKETIKERERKIILAYNNIIKNALPIWTNDNKELRERIKNKLTDVYYRLKNCLKILKSDAILTTTLDAEVKFKETNEEVEDDILQSKLTYDKDTFNALLDEFDEWDKKITRKNASEKDEIIELRTKKIINAYNKLVEFAKPIIESNNEKSTEKIRDEVNTRREYILDDLRTLNSDIEVPKSITEKITTNTDDSNDPSTSKKNENKGENKNTNPMNNKNNTDNKPEVKMAMTANEYYKMCNQQLNYTYTGDPLGLPPLIDSIELLQFMDTTKAFEDILLRVLKTKLMGAAREYIAPNATVDEIKATLKKKIKVKNSKIVMGQLMALKADRTNFTDYAKKAEDLAEQFNRSLILEKIPTDTANEMTIDKTIELCLANTRSQVVQSVLESTHFDDPKEVIAKYIIQERKQQGVSNNQVLAMHRNNRFNNNRNFQQNRFQRNNYNNNHNRNRNNDQRPNFNRNNAQHNRNNFRGRGNNYRGNQNGNWRNNRRQQSGRIYYAENNESLPSGGNQTQQVQIQQAEQ